MARRRRSSRSSIPVPLPGGGSFRLPIRLLTQPRWLLVLAIVVGAVWLWNRWSRRESGPTADVSTGSPAQVPAPAAGGYLLGFWNVENLFDDRNDFHDNDPMEDFFGNNPEMVRSKVDALARTLLAQNGGRGPDILAVVEVENRRAVELLRDRLNAGLPDALKYSWIVHNDLLTGRRIDPAVISRLPVRPERTRTFGQRRMIEATVVVDDQPLVLLVSHWTSRLTDKTGEKRMEYALACYSEVRHFRNSDPNADVLLCGDFNDTPEDASVRLGLHAVSKLPNDGDTASASDGRLFDLTAATIKPPGAGTYRYQRRWQVLDHLVVTPGLFQDKGWKVRPETVQAVTAPEADGIPRAFGGVNHQGQRGPSDHMALLVRLVVPNRDPRQP